MKSRYRLWQALTLVMLLILCSCELTDREKAAADTAAIGFFAGSAVGCTAAAIADSRSAAAFSIGCPVGMVLGAAIGGAIGYASYHPQPPAAAAPGHPPWSTTTPPGAAAVPRAPLVPPSH